MPTREIELRSGPDGSPWLEIMEGGVSHGTWSKRLIGYFLGEGAAEVGRWKITAEKVVPRAARIKRPCNAGNEEGFEFFCGRCGLLVAKDAETCTTYGCGSAFVCTVGMANLRIGGDGKPLVEE